MNEKLSMLKENQKDFLGFLRSRYSLFHLSNVFFRDLHYGVMAYLNLKGVSSRYTEAEDVTKALVEQWQAEEILRRIDARAFMLNYPDFKKPSTKPAAPAKPAAKPAPPAAAKPAAAKPASEGAAKAAEPTAAPKQAAATSDSKPPAPKASEPKATEEKSDAKTEAADEAQQKD